ncbi:hypothetical protein CLOP_g22292 [Closterium sp. NIES-67]|nr:hypothetical protein CLOP_g22292 [Closterium sp. NIES-67]
MADSWGGNPRGGGRGRGGRGGRGNSGGRFGSGGRGGRGFSGATGGSGYKGSWGGSGSGGGFGRGSDGAGGRRGGGGRGRVGRGGERGGRGGGRGDWGRYQGGTGGEVGRGSFSPGDSRKRKFEGASGSSDEGGGGGARGRGWGRGGGRGGDGGRGGGRGGGQGRGAGRGESAPSGPMDRKQRKELAEARKKRRRPLFDLEKELTLLWEKSRQRNIDMEKKHKLVTSMIAKMKGKMKDEREMVFAELRPHCRELAIHPYAHHLVNRMMDHASKEKKHDIIGQLRGHVVEMMRHPVASAARLPALHTSPALSSSVRVLLPRVPPLPLARPPGSGHLSDLLADLPTGTTRQSVLQHLEASLQPILEKGIVDHSLFHRVLADYLQVISKREVAEVRQHLMGALLLRMVHTRDGVRIANTMVAQATPKEVRRVVKALKGVVARVACDDHGHLLLLQMLESASSGPLTRFVVKELIKDLFEVMQERIGRRFLLQLLAPSSHRYLPPDAAQAVVVGGRVEEEGEEEEEEGQEEEGGDDDGEEGEEEEGKEQGGAMEEGEGEEEEEEGQGGEEMEEDEEEEEEGGEGRRRRVKRERRERKGMREKREKRGRRGRRGRKGRRRKRRGRERKEVPQLRSSARGRGRQTARRERLLPLQQQQMMMIVMRRRRMRGMRRGRGRVEGALGPLLREGSF